MKKIFLGAILFTGTTLFAQDSSKLNPFSFSGYAEAYYTYDFNKPSDNNRPGFIYSHNRHNEFNLNLGFVKAAYSADRVRANLALAAGTYMNANYAAEPGVLKNVYEANVGVKISKTKNLWIDAGIMPSHIGFESAVSKDCWVLTRSILADNSPYYEAGAKLTYTTNNGKWVISGMALNGWQRIARLNGNSLMSWGSRVQFKPTSKVLLNYSNFVGTDTPDSIRQNRLFHNFYGIFNITRRLAVTTGFDIGTEDIAPGGNQKNTWYAPVIIIKYAFNSKWAIAGRVEHYNDKNGVIIPAGSPNGFQTTGFSVNIDHSPLSNVMARLEVRSLYSKDEIFIKASGISKNNSFVTGSVAVSF
jgi:hypothetical protein